MPRAKILVVGDGIAVSEDIRRRLKLIGYSSISAMTASEAMKKASTARPDLVLMDTRPGSRMDCAGLARRMLDELHLPVVYLTRHADTKTLARARTSHSYGYLPCPFSDPELRASIELALCRHGTEDRLSNSESRCSALLRSLADGIIATDRKGFIVFMNPAAEKLTGWSIGQAAGKHLSEVFRVLCEETRTPVAVHPARLVRGATHAHVIEEAILLARDKTEHHIDSSASAILSESGAVTGVVHVFHDITERHIAEEKAMARRRIQAVGALAGAIARDFGGLLKTITESASLLLDSLIPKTRAHADALRIVETSNHAGDLIQRLTNVARASAPAHDQPPRPVCTSDGIIRAARLLDATFSEAGIKLVTGNLERMPFVIADQAQFVDAMTCLFLNAADAMPGGGTITVTAMARTIAHPNLRFNPHAKKGVYTVLRIADTGQGMASDMVDQVFAPLSSTKNSAPTKGLGLTVVHNAVLSWGGWISVSSELGKGTAFTLYIPKAEGRNAGTGSRRTGRTILLIDDKESDLSAIQILLEKEGYRVHATTSAEEGLLIFARRYKQIALVITDLIMPGMDGRDVFHSVRKRNGNIGVVITCGFSRDYVRNCLGVSGWGFAQKPIEKDLFLSTVARTIEPVRPDAQPGTLAS